MLTDDINNYNTQLLIKVPGIKIEQDLMSASLYGQPTELRAAILKQPVRILLKSVRKVCFSANFCKKILENEGFFKLSTKNPPK
jgi:hypothetical protein